MRHSPTTICLSLASNFPHPLLQISKLLFIHTYKVINYAPFANKIEGLCAIRQQLPETFNFANYIW
jgi:hypothetical protein